MHLDRAGLLNEIQCGQRNSTHDIHLQQGSFTRNVKNMTYVDATVSFDTVSHDGLWKVMTLFECSPRLIAIVMR